MLLHIPRVLSAEQVREFRHQLDDSAATLWADGRATVGAQGAQVKRNQQLPADHPVAQALGARVQQVLAANPMFFSAVLPLRTLAPMFNRYEGGGTYGLHVDGAVMSQRDTSQRLRSDVSSTLFLSDPDEYEGGELVVFDTYGTHEVKLPAGDLIVYPSSSLHRVEPVTHGARVSSFFWTQSMVRDDWQRTMLYELDQTIQKLRARGLESENGGENGGESEEVLALTGHYHNLLRLWVEV